MEDMSKAYSFESTMLPSPSFLTALEAMGTQIQRY